MNSWSVSKLELDFMMDTIRQVDVFGDLWKFHLFASLSLDFAPERFAPGRFTTCACCNVCLNQPGTLHKHVM